MKPYLFPTLILCLACAFNAHAQQQLPYNQTFDDASAFEEFVVLDANGDNFTWKYDSFSAEASCERDMYADADDWLFTPIFALKAGTEYTLSFDGHTQYGGNDEVFDLLIGSEALPTAMKQHIAEGLSVNETYPLKHFEQNFTVEADGDYRIAFHHRTTGETYGNALLIDNLSLTATAADVEDPRPAAVTDLVFTYDYDSRAVKLKWKAPTTTVDGKPLDASSLTYTVTRLGSDAPVVTDFPGTTFREELRLSDLNEANVFFGQGLARYIVVAKDAQGQVSDKTFSNFKVIGTPYTIPYAESFAAGNPSSFWGESHEGIGRWLPLAASDTYVKDADGGMYSFTSVQGGDTGIGFSGLIDLAGAANPVLSFWYFCTEFGSDELQVMAAADGGDFETLQDLDASSVNRFRTSNQVTVPLTAYADSRFVQVAFSNRSLSGSSLVYVDDIRIFNQVERDLAIEVLELPVNLRPDEPRQATVRVRNNGMQTAAAGDCLVEFTASGMVIGTATPAADLPSGGETDLIIPIATSPALEGDSVEVTARVVLDGDENPDNNATSPCRLRLLLPSYPVPTALYGNTAAEGVVLTWQQPEAPRAEGHTVTDSFEDAPDFTITNWGDWILHDASGCNVYGVEQYDFPNMGLPQAYTVLNPEAVGMSAGWAAHTGSKLLAAFASGNCVIDHWLISPELPRCRQTISFFAKAYSKTYPETFEVLSTSESIDTGTFTKLAKYTTPKGSNDWQEYQVELPAGSKYFAIRAVSDDTFALLLDDVTFMPDTCGVQDIRLLGYNVYRDGEKLNEVPVVATTFTDTDVADGDHLYRVSAVYDAGESVWSAPVSLTTVGISTVVSGTAPYNPLYDLQGRRIKHPASGIVLQGGRKVYVPSDGQ